MMNDCVKSPMAQGGVQMYAASTDDCSFCDEVFANNGPPHECNCIPTRYCWYLDTAANCLYSRIGDSGFINPICGVTPEMVQGWISAYIETLNLGGGGDSGSDDGVTQQDVIGLIEGYNYLAGDGLKAFIQTCIDASGGGGGGGGDGISQAQLITYLTEQNYVTGSGAKTVAQQCITDGGFATTTYVDDAISNVGGGGGGISEQDAIGLIEGYNYLAGDALKAFIQTCIDDNGGGGGGGGISEQDAIGLIEGYNYLAGDALKAFIQTCINDNGGGGGGVTITTVNELIDAKLETFLCDVPERPDYSPCCDDKVIMCAKEVDENGAATDQFSPLAVPLSRWSAPIEADTIEEGLENLCEGGFLKVPGTDDEGNACVKIYMRCGTNDDGSAELAELGCVTN